MMRGVFVGVWRWRKFGCWQRVALAGFLLLTSAAVCGVRHWMRPAPPARATLGLEAAEAVRLRFERAGGPDRCVNCHEQSHVAPRATQEWRESKHAAKGVGCIACHGDFHATVHDRHVSPSVCAECHGKEAKAFARGRHSRAATSIAAHPETVRQSKAVAEQGCDACHGIGAAFVDGGHPQAPVLNGRCNSCHEGHGYKLDAVRRVDACTACHTGQGSPQTELVAASRHAQCFAGKNACLQCHDPHDDSLGITMGGSGSGARKPGLSAPWATTTLTAAQQAFHRQAMIAKCTGCHLRSDAERTLHAADAVKLEADAALEEMFELFPKPRDPKLGQLADVGGRAGVLLFDAVKRGHSGMWKAAYHQAPSPLVGARRDLDRIRAELKEWLAQQP